MTIHSTPPGDRIHRVLEPGGPIAKHRAEHRENPSCRASAEVTSYPKSRCGVRGQAETYVGSHRTIPVSSTDVYVRPATARNDPAHWRVLDLCQPLLRASCANSL